MSFSAKEPYNIWLFCSKETNQLYPCTELPRGAGCVQGGEDPYGSSSPFTTLRVTRKDQLSREKPLYITHSCQFSAMFPTRKVD